MGISPTAALLQQIFEVDPLACPSGHGVMRLVSFITQSSVIDQILTPLRTRASTAVHTGARSPPPPGPRRPRAPRADRPRHTAGPEHRPRTPRQRAGRSACAVAHPPVFARSTITPDTQSTAIEIPLPSRHVVAGSRDTGAAAGRRRLRTAGAGPAVYRHEGKLVAIVALEAADAVLAAMHAHPLGRSGARQSVSVTSAQPRTASCR